MSSELSLFTAAMDFSGAGCSVIPVKADGSKAPAVPWKQFQTARATDEQLASWFVGHDHGVGVVCWAVWGWLEMCEFEGRAVLGGYPQRMAEAMAAHGLVLLWNRLWSGYVEITPTGGLHFYYRVSDGPARGNTKLARRPGPDGTVEVLMETRGEGGYTVVAPTPGRFHPSGQPWLRLCGDPSSIPSITAEERDTLYAIATLLDEMPVAPPIEPGNVFDNPHALATTTGGVRPGDDYNARTSWDEILLPLGWTKVRPMGHGYAWRRPGKQDPGISATTGQSADGADRFYSFSTSTEFPAETPMSKFAVYTQLEHGGDYSAAARALAGKGYGSRATPATRAPAQRGHLAAVPAQPVDGTAALAVTDNGAVPPEGDTEYPRHTDSGNGEALIDLYGPQLRYDCDRGRWLTYDGNRWQLQPPGGGDAREYAKDAATRMPVGDDDKAAARWRDRSLSALGITATLISASTDPRVVVHTNQLDADPYLLGTPGGVVELRTGTLRAGRPEDLITRCTSVTPEFGPTPPIWQEFLATTFSGDAELIGYVQRLFGLALIGEVLEQVMAFFHGELGANGKSTIKDVTESLLGVSDDGYALEVPSEILMVRRHEGHSTELAQLVGRRLIFATELEEGQRLAEARIKLITGGDRISARFLYGQPFTFKPSHLVVLIGNHKPQVSVGGPALWRRIVAVPFEHQVPAELRDPILPQRLLEVGGAILGWMIAGAVDYLTRGIRTPRTVSIATEEYEAEQDTIGRFWEERCMPSPNGRIAFAEIYGAYQKWCSAAGETATGPKHFSQQMTRRFPVTDGKGSRGVRSLMGVLLYADESGEPDPAEQFLRDWRDR